MENRWNERQLIKLNVMIFYAPLGLIRGIAKDISSHGMFVESGRIVLCSEELIQVSFLYNNLDDEKSYTIPAHVVHSGQRGAGLQFFNYIFSPHNTFTENSTYSVSG